LSVYNGGINMSVRSNAEFITQAFASSTEDQQTAYVVALWFSNLFIVCFALWTFAIVRSTNAEAVPQWFKVIAYVSCIPLVVVFQWATNTFALYMFAEYIAMETVSASTASRWYNFQITTWVMQGLCALAILVSLIGQMAYCSRNCRTKKSNWKEDVQFRPHL